VPDGSRDLPVEKAILLEAGFDELNGVDWQKGCYIGQELTARTKYRGLIKKRLMPVRVAGALPPPGTPVMLDGQDAGELRSGQDGIALALLRLEAVAAAAASGEALHAGDARLTPLRPDWARF
jgi:tRNA-modifying protein YgfZ